MQRHCQRRCHCWRRCYDSSRHTHTHTCTNCGWFEVIVSVTCLPHTHTCIHTCIQSIYRTHTHTSNELHCSQAPRLLSLSLSLSFAAFASARERNSFTFSRSFLTSVVIVVAIIVVFGNFDRHVEPCGICVWGNAQRSHPYVIISVYCTHKDRLNWF